MYDKLLEFLSFKSLKITVVENPEFWASMPQVNSQMQAGHAYPSSRLNQHHLPRVYKKISAKKLSMKRNSFLANHCPLV